MNRETFAGMIARRGRQCVLAVRAWRGTTFTADLGHREVIESGERRAVREEIDSADR